jgi:hypothetical protein
LSVANARLAINGIVGHTTVRGGRVQAWYRVSPVGWEYRPDAEREQRIISTADGYSQLVGRWLHLRVTTRPWSVRDWARAHDRTAQDPLPVWPEHLIALQRQLGGQSLATKETYLGVDVPSTASSRLRELYAAPMRAVGAMPRRMARQTVRDTMPAIVATDEVMARTGFAARPVEPREMEWLLHRSVSLGLPAPLTLGAVDAPDWDADDLGEFTDEVQWAPEPFGRTVTVAGEHKGEPIERHVCVLTLGRMSEMEIPGSSEPWLQRLDRLPFPVEVSARIFVEDDVAVRTAMRKAIQKVRAQTHHYEVEHAEPAPQELARQGARALAIEAELTAGLAGLASRTRSWVRLAVSGESPRDARDRAEEVRKLYSPQVTVHRPLDQYRVGREFIPGEPMGASAHVRRMPVVTLAAAMPNATAQWGDRHGIPLGETAGTSVQAAVLDFWDATEHNESGLCVVSAGLGGGKTNLVGWIVYCAAVAGVPFDVLDPSGRLQALEKLPELKGRCRVVDLLDGEPGVLAPYRVVADPVREHYPDPEEFSRRLRNAQDARRELAQATLHQLAPHKMAEHELTEVALLEAIAAVRPVREASLIQVVEALERLDADADHELAAHGRRLAKFYRQVASTGPGRLLFAAGYTSDYGADPADGPILTVYSLRGLAIPDDGASRSLGLAERLALCLLSNAAWLTTRRMYFGHPDERKGVAIDEARVLRRVSTGRALMEAVSADSRKHNTVAFIIDQLPSKLVELGLPNLASMAFMGRLTDPREQAAAIEFLPGIRPGEGYESIFGTLSAAAKRASDADVATLPVHDNATAPDSADAVETVATKGRTNESREFIARDWRGQVEKIAVVLESHPHVQQALDSTSRSARVRRTREKHDSVLADVVALADEVVRAEEEGSAEVLPVTAYQEA